MDIPRTCSGPKPPDTTQVSFHAFAIVGTVKPTEACKRGRYRVVWPKRESPNLPIMSVQLQLLGTKLSCDFWTFFERVNQFVHIRYATFYVDIEFSVFQDNEYIR